MKIRIKITIFKKKPQNFKNRVLVNLIVGIHISTIIYFVEFRINPFNPKFTYKKQKYIKERSTKSSFKSKKSH